MRGQEAPSEDWLSERRVTLLPRVTHARVWENGVFQEPRALGLPLPSWQGVPVSLTGGRRDPLALRYGPTGELCDLPAVGPERDTSASAQEHGSSQTLPWTLGGGFVKPSVPPGGAGCTSSASLMRTMAV